MNRISAFWPFIVTMIGSLLAMSGARSDEGMWLLENPPRELLQEKYGFTLTDAWLERARMASVRFNNGGSGGFVSAEGLIVTNHHIGADALQKLSTPERNLLRDGYHARNQAEELKCPDLELNVLQSMEDVTGQVEGAVQSDMTPAQAFAARRAVMAAIEKESLDKTGLRSDVVTLYQGGLYHLYRYKKYTDVRLVFAPESAIAGFGGDVDNFEYPRYNLDVCFFRAYENDRPAKPAHYLRWSAQGPRENDLVFVTGHPGTTNRLETLAKLLQRRDGTLPYTLNRLRFQEALLLQYASRGPEQDQQAQKFMHRVANARKAISGQYQGLLDPSILARKRQAEIELRNRFNEQNKGQKSEDPWESIAKAQKDFGSFEKEYYLLERGDAFDSELFQIARQLLRLTMEKPKPNADRLREYRDSALESLEFQLYSPAPISVDLERVRLAGSLSFLCEQLGGDHPLVVKILAGQAPAARATQLLKGCTLADPKERKAIVNKGSEAIETNQDPMLLLARLIDPESRALRQRFENEVEEVERQASARIARLRFQQFGRNLAPDATFTLRLAFGTVRGYNVEGQSLPFHTDFAGVFSRAERLGGREPFNLPKRWLDRKNRLNLATPFNFVSTSDTIGGNSGSPVLNRGGELVGINFDRNRHGLVRNFVYTDEQARHIAVHSQAVLEALRKVYEAENLLRELGPS